MTNLTRPHPDVDAEYFFIFELGIAIRIHPFTTVMFSGLYYHCGHQAYYRTGPRKDPRLYVCLTLIAYPPSGLLHGTTSSAFGLMGSGVLKVPTEAKLWTKLFDWKRPPTAQATYGVDGVCIMEPRDYANHFIRSIMQLVLALVMQSRPELLIRFDAQALMAAFTFVDDQVRVAPDIWKYVPGWEKEDVAVGHVYPVAPSELPLDALRDLRNSDEETEHPFNRGELAGIFSSWDPHCAEQARSIPLCVVAQERDGVIGGKDTTRKQLNQEIRGTDSGDEDEEEDISVPEKKKKKKKRKGSTKPTLCTQCCSSIENDGAKQMETRKSSGRPDGKRKRGSHTTTHPNPDLGPDSLSSDTSSSDADGDYGYATKRSKLTAKGHAKLPASMAVAAAGTMTRGRKAKEDVLYGPGVHDSDSSSPMSPSEGLLRYLQHDYLLGYYEDLKATVSGLQSWDEEIAVSYNLVTDIADLCASREVYHAWALHEQFTAAAEGLYVELQHHRGSIMLSNMILWEWVSFTLEEGYTHYSNKLEHWLSPAFTSAYESMVNRGVQHSMDARRLIAGYQGSMPEHILHASRRMHHDVFSKEASIAIVRSALMTWFGFNKASQGQLQARFIRELIDTIGMEVVVLPPIWEAYQSLSGTVARSSLFRLCRPTKEEMDRWLAAMRGLAVCQSASTEAHILHRIYTDSCNSSTNINPFDSKAINAYCQTATTPFLTSSSAPPSPGFPNLSGTPTTSSVTPAPLPSPSNPPSLPTYVKAAEFHKLVAEITLLLPFLPPTGQNPSTWTLPSWKTTPSPKTFADHHQNFLADVKADDDRLLPFRDMALSRRRVLAWPGPYSPEHLYTKEGLFSALVYRGITHNSQYLRESPLVPTTYFPSREVWLALKDSRHSTELCNRNAYGPQTIKERTVDLGEGFWVACQEPELTSWLLNSDGSSFSKVYKMFVDSKTKKKDNLMKGPEHEEEETRPSMKDMTIGMGKLVLYLLVADYAIAGAVPMPSAPEMGSIIWSIGKGGKDGLELLGFDISSKIAVTNSFVALDALIRAHIAPDNLDAMGYNFFVLEHMLCKHKRLRERPTFKNAYAAMNR